MVKRFGIAISNCKGNLWSLLRAWNISYVSVIATVFINQHLLLQSQQWKHQFKVNNKVIDVVLMSLFLTLNRCHTLPWYCHCWIWKSKYRLSEWSQYSTLTASFCRCRFSVLLSGIRWSVSMIYAVQMKLVIVCDDLIHYFFCFWNRTYSRSFISFR